MNDFLLFESFYCRNELFNDEGSYFLPLSLNIVIKSLKVCSSRENFVNDSFNSHLFANYCKYECLTISYNLILSLGSKVNIFFNKSIAFVSVVIFKNDFFLSGYTPYNTYGANSLKFVSVGFPINSMIFSI